MARTNDETELAQQNRGDFSGDVYPTVVGDEDDDSVVEAEAIADAILAAGRPDKHGIVWVDDPRDSPYSAWDLELEDETEIYSQRCTRAWLGYRWAVYESRLPSGRTLVWVRWDDEGTPVIAVVQGDPRGWRAAVEEWAEATFESDVLDEGDAFWSWYLAHNESVLGQGWPWHLEGAPDFSELWTLEDIESGELGPELLRLEEAIRDELDGEAATPERRLFLAAVQNALDELWWLSEEYGQVDSLGSLVAAPSTTIEEFRSFVVETFRELLDDNGVEW